MYAAIELLSGGTDASTDGYATTSGASAKLISTGSTCSKSTPSRMGGPWNGEIDQDDFLKSGRTPATIVYREVVFPEAGSFQVCYSRDNTVFETLAPVILVEGSNSANNRVWCSLPVMNRKDKYVCGNEDKSTDPAGVKPRGEGCLCKGQIQGNMHVPQKKNLAAPGAPENWNWAPGTFSPAPGTYQFKKLGKGSPMTMEDGTTVKDIGTELFVLGYADDMNSNACGRKGGTLAFDFTASSPGVGNKIGVVEDSAFTTDSAITYNFGMKGVAIAGPRIYHLCYCLNFWQDTSTGKICDKVGFANKKTQERDPWVSLCIGNLGSPVWSLADPKFARRSEKIFNSSQFLPR